MGYTYGYVLAFYIPTEFSIYAKRTISFGTSTPVYGFSVGLKAVDQGTMTGALIQAWCRSKHKGKVR